MTRCGASTPARLDARLLGILDRSWDEAVAKAGTWLACRPACFECCLGPFPITALDASRLERGLTMLARREPVRAEAIAARARADVDAMTPSFPGDARSGELHDDDAVERFLVVHASRPCPALDPVSGLCELYEHRLVSCRTFGPPTRIGAEVLPPCRLCFQGASISEIERCRVAPDPDGVEDRLVGDRPETLVAFALRDAVGPPASIAGGRRRTGQKPTPKRTRGVRNST